MLRLNGDDLRVSVDAAFDVVIAIAHGASIAPRKW